VRLRVQDIGGHVPFIIMILIIRDFGRLSTVAPELILIIEVTTIQLTIFMLIVFAVLKMSNQLCILI
jgi:hypothetical protein